MDMNSLLSGLAESQKNGSKKCDCDNNNNNNGGNSIIWIIVLLLLFCSQGQVDSGTVCGCDPKHCKELCRCGPSKTGGFGLGGFGGGCGGGSGIWIIILILLFVGTGNNRNKGCTNNIINLDGCDEE